MNLLKQKGLTLIEMAVIIVVVGIALPVLMRMWSDVSIRSADSESISDATFLAQELMEEIRSKKFVDPEEPDNTALGINADDTYKDDADDYDAYEDSPLNGYARKAVVKYRYLDSGDRTWKDSANPTEYKYIQVIVESTTRAGEQFSLSTIVARQ